MPRPPPEPPSGGSVRDLCAWAVTADAAALEWLAARGAAGAVAWAHRHNEQQDFAAAVPLAEAALAAESDEEVRAHALLQLGIARLHLGEVQACLDRCDEGLGVAARGRVDDALLGAELRAQAAVACRQLGLRSRALRLNLAALAALSAAPEEAEERQLVATLHNNLGTLYVLQGDPASAVGHFEQGLALTEQTDAAAPVAVVQHVNLGKVLLKLGRADDAAGHLERAVALAVPLGPSVVLRAQEGLAHARRVQGRAAEAVAIMEPVVAAWEARAEPLMLAMARLALGEALADLGDPAAEAVLDAARRGAGEIPLPDVVIGALEGLVRVWEGQGRFAEACDGYRELQEHQRDRYDADRARAAEELRANHEADRRRQEAQALRDHADVLEALVSARTASLRERNAELEEARDGARRANQAKSTFLAVTSHELRTPLHGITGYTEMLLDDLADGAMLDPDALAADLDRILQSARRLQKLIERILTLTNLEADEVPLQLDTVPLEGLLASLMEPLRPVAEARGNRLTLQVGPEARAPMVTDPQLLGQVVHHLVDNALRFTDDGSVTIEANRHGDELVIAVHDTGVGVPPEAIDELFQPFHQLDMSYTRSHEGLGLGLALCQLQARALGGEVRVAATHAQGSTFEVALPWTRAPRRRNT